MADNQINQQQMSIEYVRCASALKTSLESIEQRDVITFVVKNCPSVDDTITLVTQNWFVPTILTRFSTLTGLRMRINDDIAEIAEKWQPRVNGRESGLVITFESTVKNQTLVWWKNGNEKGFLKLNLVKEDIVREVKNFAIDFIIEELCCENGKVTSGSGDVLSFSTLVKSTGSNLLMDAIVVKKDLLLVEELLKQPFDVNEEICTGWQESETGKRIPVLQTLADFAWEEDAQEILLALVKAGSVYPKDFDKDMASDEVYEFLKIGESLHKSIKRKEIEKVREIISKNKDQRFFFNEDNISAVHTALLRKKAEIFQLLLEHNLTFGPNEDFKGVYDNEFGELICKINTELAKSLPQRHIMMLLSKSVVPRCDTDTSQSLTFIRSSLERLDSMLLIKPVLPILAINKRAKFHYDFTQWWAVFMDPTLSNCTRGVYNSKSKHTHIATKGLLFKETKNETEALMTHEFFHNGLDDTFHNKRLPFDEDDEVNKEKWQEILEYCKRLMDADDIVASVFRCYNEEAWARELAVRAPHMLVHYQNDEAQLEILREVFKSLFDYHENFVIPAMIEAAPVLEKLANDLIDIKYEELTGPLKAAVRNAEVNFQGEKVKLKLIADSEVLKCLKSEQIRQILNKNTLDIAKSQESKEFYMKRRFIESNYKDEVYEGRDKLSEKAKTLVKTLTELCDELKTSKTLLLVDVAGEGKSTTMRHTARELKKKFPHHWVSFVDLKRHLSVYREIENETLDAESIFVRIFALDSLSFEFAIFVHLFKSNRAIFLLDGVDEIAPRFKNLIFDFITKVQGKTSNWQLIASRPQYAREMEELFKCRAYRLLPLSHTQALSFMRRTGDSSRPVVLLSSSFALFNGGDASASPLILKMLAQLAQADQLHFLALDCASVYEQLVAMKKGIVAEEKSAIVNRDMTPDSSMSIDQVHQVYALKLIFHDERVQKRLSIDESLFGTLYNIFYSLKTYVSLASTVMSAVVGHFWPAGAAAANNDAAEYMSLHELALFKRWRSEKKNWTPAIIARLGLLTVDHWNTKEEMPDFVHRTFAEHFVAKFLIEELREACEEVENTEASRRVYQAKMTLLLNILYTIVEGNVSRNILVTLAQYFTQLLEERDIPCKEMVARFLKNPQFLEFLVDFIAMGKRTNHFWVLLIPSARFFAGNKTVLSFIEFYAKKDLQALFKKSLELGNLHDSIELFDAFKRSCLPSWHHLTGLGLDLKASELKLPTEAEIEKLSADCKENKDFFGKLHNRSDEVALMFFQLLCFLTTVKGVKAANVRKLLNKQELFCVFILRSPLIINKVSELIRKRWKENHKGFCITLSSLLNAFAQTMLLAINMDFSSLKNNMEHFISVHEEISSAEVTCSNDFLYAIVLHDLGCFKRVVVKNRTPHEVLKEIAEKIPTMLPLFLTVEHIERLDAFSKDLSKNKFKTVFQLFFNLCEDFESILTLARVLWGLFKHDWLEHTGYRVRDDHDREEMQKMTFADVNDDEETTRAKSLLQLVSVLLLCEIRGEDLERFKMVHGERMIVQLKEQIILDGKWKVMISDAVKCLNNQHYSLYAPE